MLLTKSTLEAGNPAVHQRKVATVAKRKMILRVDDHPYEVEGEIGNKGQITFELPIGITLDFRDEHEIVLEPKQMTKHRN